MRRLAAVASALLAVLVLTTGCLPSPSALVNDRFGADDVVLALAPAPTGVELRLTFDAPLVDTVIRIRGDGVAAASLPSSCRVDAGDVRCEPGEAHAVRGVVRRVLMQSPYVVTLEGRLLAVNAAASFYRDEGEPELSGPYTELSVVVR